MERRMCMVIINAQLIHNCLMCKAHVEPLTPPVGQCSKAE